MTRTTSIIIFGASGDLNQRKLIPALFNLCRKDRMPEKFIIVGYSRTPYDDKGFRQLLYRGLEQFAGYSFFDPEWEAFASQLHYHPGSYTEAADFDSLNEHLKTLEGGPADRLFYLATPPDVFAPIVKELGRTGMVDEHDGWRRVVIEKPFGTDLESAVRLNRSLQSVLEERQIYRIDHYLGKETVQNLLVFRFANTIFEPLWNRTYIDNVQITVAEEVGVGHRAHFYDTVGVLRDMFQNHLLQLLTLVAMEPPNSFNADALRDERAKVLSAVRPMLGKEIAENTVRGQYRGYLDEPGVAPNSQTPTFAALRLYVDNWRWQGVPFYLRSGKNLATKVTEIRILFRCPPHVMFPLPRDFDMTPNSLVIMLQPDEGIHLRFETKVPDTVTEMRSVDMEFHYSTAFGQNAIPEAYERLLLDAMNGDASLFTRADQVELGWRLMDPIISTCEGQEAPVLEPYEPGNWGPAAAEALVNWSGTCCGC